MVKKRKYLKNIYSCNLIIEIEKVFYNNQFASELKFNAMFDSLTSKCTNKRYGQDLNKNDVP
jgi:hypothetical protein